MPSRLTLTFPGYGGDKDITFTCDSGDYDPGPELDLAMAQVLQGLVISEYGVERSTLELEDV